MLFFSFPFFSFCRLSIVYVAELIFCFFSPFQSLFKHKTINHKHKILHLFIIFLRLLCVAMARSVGRCFYSPVGKEVSCEFFLFRDGVEKVHDGVMKVFDAKWNMNFYFSFSISVKGDSGWEKFFESVCSKWE